MDNAMLAEAIRQSPFDDLLRQRQIAACLEQGLLADAVAAVSAKAEICGLRPQDGKLLIQLHSRLRAAGAAMLLEQLMSHDQARTVTADINVAHDAEAQAIWQACDKLMRYGVYDAARDLLDQALLRWPAEPLMHHGKIRLYLELADYSACATAVNGKQRVCGLDKQDGAMLSKLYSLLKDAGLRSAEIDIFLSNDFVQQVVAGNAKYSGFESLGMDCELGFAQRKLGQEPLGLLRFSGIPFDTLIALLNNDFRDFALPENCELKIIRLADQSQYDLYDRVYRYDMHTFVVADTSDDAADVLKKFCARAQFLKRKLLDDLASGDKIFVYKNDHCSEREARKLSRALLRHGPNRLLVVREFDRRRERAHGALVRVGGHILNGYLERFDVHVIQPEHLLEWRGVLDGALREFSERPPKASLLGLSKLMPWLRRWRGGQAKAPSDHAAVR